ncbi:MAG TPA: helix-turn-helix transcriptional regulator [Streptosporangiaceae bacterium]|nr:helix-turn-helix transcriptional regulator [Streptosporangiaceae bacterium]
MSETVRQALRTLREAAGVSTARLARQVTFSESHLRNIENGHRQLTLEAVEAYDDALGASGILVDLFLADQNGDEMRRRAALSLLGTITGLGLAGSQVIAESLRESLLSAVGASDWGDVAEEYGQRFMSDAPHMFQKRLTGDLLVLRQTIVTTDSPGSRIAAPRLMMLHGMITANLGDVVGAARWYRAARLTADRTSDESLRQWTRGREAFRRGYEGASPSEVLTIGWGVDDVEAQLAVAEAYARLCDRSNAISALDRARRIHETADQSETTIYAMPPWRMALSSAYVYALLGDVNSCDSELAAVAPPAAVQRWESQLELERAVAHSCSGDVTTGSVIAERVMRETRDEERSVVLMEMYREARKCQRARKP